jgi:integrase
MSRVYNEEVKNRFLNTFTNEGTQKTINSIFIKSATTEETLGKDLYNFSTEDLIDVFKEINPKSKSVSMSSGRFIKQYISWCIKKGYRDNNDNPVNGLDQKWFAQFVDRKLKIHYAMDEFIDLLQDVQNYQDKMLLCLLWNGISGERFSQLTELKRSDINFENNTVYVKQRDYHVSINPEFMDIIQKGMDENIYLSYVPKSGEFKEKGLLPSQFILRNVRSPRTVEGSKISMAVIYNRFAAIKDYLDLEYLTPKALEQSGMIKMAVDIYNDQGVLGYEQLALIGEKYDYSTITSSDGQYTYYNTYLIKEFLNENTIKDLYDLDIEITKR